MTIELHSGAGDKMNEKLDTRSQGHGKGKYSGSQFKYVPPQWYRLAIYDFILWFFKVIFDIFFREIRPRGAFRLPRTGPVIFVGAPHANQFVDPMILMQQVYNEAQRRISFLVAAKSYKRKFIGLMARCQLSIPVIRAQDNLAKGSGKIFVDFASDPLLVTGKGTQFTKECTVKGLIALPQSLGAMEITEIISDTQLRIRKEFKNTTQIKTLLRKGTSYSRADKVDQKLVYQTVFEHLAHGHCIGIFPEGGSHDRTDLLPLKAGVAIMALGAMDNDPNCNVKIVPCGMNYFNAHKFRSRAVIEFGKPIEISQDLVRKYANPETNRESVKELLEIISTGLKAVTVTCEDYETLMVVQAARRLYAGNFALHLPLPLVVEMNRRLVLGYQTYKDNPQICSLKQKIMTYNEQLKHLYLPDHFVEDCDESNKLRVVPIFLFRIVKLIFFSILALPGTLLFSPVFICSKIISKQKAKEALANSTVKVQANDVVATWKILIGMGIAPIVYSFWATLGTTYCYLNEILSDYKLIWLWLGLYMLGVLLTYSALITGEQGMDLFKSLRPLYLSITSGSSVRELKAFRQELSQEITEVVNTLGPELFPDDFNLLNLKERLNIKDNVEFVDSDDEEDKKTEELKRRRLRNRKAAKHKKSSSGSLIDASASVSDGISLMNSDNSLTNIPMFSDYQLHMNARNSQLKIDLQSNFNSSVSLYDDYNQHIANSTPPYQRPNMSRTNSGMEINFPSKAGSLALSEKIKRRLREGRDNN
mgnify:CR=1 FL=1